MALESVQYLCHVDHLWFLLEQLIEQPPVTPAQDEHLLIAVVRCTYPGHRLCVYQVTLTQHWRKTVATLKGRILV